jgi:hypothetical protein
VPLPVYTQTITPPRSAVTEVSTSTQTFTRWSQVDTSTATVVTPICRTPMRPLHPDPVCTVFPNKVQIPAGVSGVHRRDVAFDEAAPSPTTTSYIQSSDTTSYSMSTVITSGRMSVFPIYPYGNYDDTSTVTHSLRPNDPWHTGVKEHRRAVAFGEAVPPALTSTPSSHLQADEKAALHKRAPDPTAVTDTSPANTTVTLTAAVFTQTNFEASTSTYYIMDAAPQTVYAGQPVQTVMAVAQPAETVTQTDFVRVYETKTFGLTWTQTLTSTPAAAVESCRAVGGNFGRRW